MSNRRFDLTEEQRNRLKFLRKDYNHSPEEIRRNPNMRKPNGEMHQLKVNDLNLKSNCDERIKIFKELQIGKPKLIEFVQVIKHWVNRVDSTGDCKIAKRSGRRRLLNEDQERELVKGIRKYCKDRNGYSTVRRKTGLLHVTTRTVNNYGIRNGFSELESIIID